MSISGQETSASLPQKILNFLRFKRRFRRNKPAPVSQRDRSDLPIRDPRCVIRGVPEYLQQVVRMRYGAKGTWGHGRYQHGTKKGPGRRPLGWSGHNPAGSKLARKAQEFKL